MWEVGKEGAVGSSYRDIDIVKSNCVNEKLNIYNFIRVYQNNYRKALINYNSD